MDEKLLAAIEESSVDALLPEGAMPKEYIFDRAISQKEKEAGIGSVFSSAEGTSGVKTYPNGEVLSMPP